AKDTIMAPMYDARESGFDEASLVLLKDGVAIRLDHANLYGKVREYLDANTSGFMEEDRREQVALLERWETSLRGRASPNAPAAPSAAPVSTAPAAAVGFETMPKEDRQTFNEAVALEATNPRDAWTLASPLFEAHPTVRAVQALRCRLAK